MNKRPLIAALYDCLLAVNSSLVENGPGLPGILGFCVIMRCFQPTPLIEVVPIVKTITSSCKLLTAVKSVVKITLSNGVYHCQPLDDLKTTVVNHP
jgi:hypothetical protein